MGHSTTAQVAASATRAPATATQGEQVRPHLCHISGQDICLRVLRGAVWNLPYRTASVVQKRLPCHTHVISASCLCIRLLPPGSCKPVVYSGPISCSVNTDTQGFASVRMCRLLTGGAAPSVESSGWQRFGAENAAWLPHRPYWRACSSRMDLQLAHERSFSLRAPARMHHAHFAACGLCSKARSRH